MPTRQPFIEPGTLVADYQVETLIARGGMGEVYLARDSRLDRWVALKVLPSDLSENEKFRSRFIRESRLAASVDHPNIIPIYGAGEVGGQLYIAMRYVRGSDLRAELARQGPLDVAGTVAVLRDTAAALDAAHAAGLIHRDVKPANILLAEDMARGPRGHVYLSDFGLTRRTTSASGLTTAGHFMGTLDYVAPEQIRGGAIDERADVYALACVAFEMLAGHPPFRRDDDTALLWAHVFEDPPRLSELVPDVPPAVDMAIMNGMAKSPDERPASCGALVARMDAFGPEAPSGRATPTREAGDLGHGARFALEPSAPQATDHERAPQAGGAGYRDKKAPRAGFPRITARRRTGYVAWALVLALLLAGAVFGLSRMNDGGEKIEFSDPDVPYTLQVPRAWTARRSEAGDSTTTVMSAPDLRDFFNEVDSADRQTAQDVKDDPASVVGLTIYHRPFLPGLSRADRVSTAEALLPGETRLVDRGMAPAGEASSQVMEGTISLPDNSSLQTRVLAVRTNPEQLLVFYAPPSLFDDKSGTFDEVAASLKLND